MADRALISTRKGLFLFTKSGQYWAVAASHFAGEPVTLALHDPRDGALYAALRLGHFGPKLHRSDDGGATWTEVAAPAFPAETDGKPTLKQIWALAAGGADEPGVIWAGGIPAGLFRSEDKGASWKLVDALWNVPDRTRWFGGGYDEAGIHSILRDPRDSRHLTVGLSCGGVWETKDAGASWATRTNGLYAVYTPPEQKYDAAIQDPHCVARCEAAPDVMWIQHHNGTFRSEDGGAHWQEMHPPISNFGFAVAAHPGEPGTAWFAPADSDMRRAPMNGRVVVNRTRDGGKSFETIGEGLPGEHAYDLIYRHGLAVDESGERLAMGSTTGGLWFSNDGGDGWSMAPARLPPIYAVAFA
jgi:hypothetical protein